MPKVIEALPKSNRGRKEVYTELYPFFTDLNYAGEHNKVSYDSGFGKAIALTKGEDYHCEDVSMRASLYRIAEANGVNVKVHIDKDNPGTVSFQAVTFEIVPKQRRKAKHA